MVKLRLEKNHHRPMGRPNDSGFSAGIRTKLKSSGVKWRLQVEASSGGFKWRLQVEASSGAFALWGLSQGPVRERTGVARGLRGDVQGEGLRLG